MAVGTAVILVMVATTGNIATVAVIVTAVGVIMTRTVTVILMAGMAVNATVIGAGALLVVIHLIIGGAKVSPGALLGAVAQLVLQGTMMALMTAPAGKFAFHYVSTWRFVGIFGFPTNIVAGQG
jgi:hypothetical protein